MPTKKKSKKKVEKLADAQRWSQTGRADAKGLAKTLPNLASQLREGSADPNDVAEQLATVNLMEGIGDGQGGGKKFALKANPSEKVEMYEFLLVALSSLACPNDEDLCYQFHIDLEAAGRQGLEGLEGVSLFSDLAKKPEDCLQAAFDSVCEKWEPRLQRVNGGRPLRETCPAYKVSQEAFVTLIHGLMMEKLIVTPEMIREVLAKAEQAKEQFQQIKSSAQGVQDGLDCIRKTCWECGTTRGEMQKCSQCQAARYCGRDCQVAAWRNGHRQCCASLKMSYERFLQNYGRVDQALKDGAIAAGCPLPPAALLDYTSMATMNIREMYPLRSETVKGPSVEYMYQSLVHIVSNRPHWMFMDLFGSWPAMLNRPPKLFETWEMSYVVLGLFFLSFNLSDTADDLAAKFKQFAINSLMQLKKSRTRPMAATRFIEIYHASGKAKEKGAALRSQIIAKSFGILKDGYHKKQDLDMSTLAKYRMNI